MRQIKNTHAIIRNGQMVGSVIAPRGTMQLFSLVLSRGNSTDYMPKEFLYVRLPNGNFFPVDKTMVRHWQESGFTINDFQISKKLKSLLLEVMS